MYSKLTRKKSDIYRQAALKRIAETAVSQVNDSYFLNVKENKAPIVHERPKGKSLNLNNDN